MSYTFVDLLLHTHIYIVISAAATSTVWGEEASMHAAAKFTYFQT